LPDNIAAQIMDPKSLLDDLAGTPNLSPFRGLVLPLADYDLKRGSDLVKTLTVYFDTGTNASETADRLFLHRNSLLYRLERIQELTGLDLKEPEARLALQLGLLAIRKGEKDEAQHP
jgi:purine catabolism regulator